MTAVAWRRPSGSDYTPAAMPDLPSQPPLLTRVFGKAAVYDIVLAPLAVVGSGLSAYGFAAQHQYVRAGIIGGAGAVVLVAGVAKAVVSYRQQRRAEQTHELESCLHTLHAVLTFDVPPDSARVNLRITILKPVAGGQRLEQILDYVGPNAARKRTAGRQFPAQSGIVGASFRHEVPIVADRVNDDYEAFVRELIVQWSYTEADARMLNPSAFAWMAIPLVEDRDGQVRVRGIVFIDSDTRGFFTPERETVAKAACIGIGRFISRRYN